MTFAAFIFTGVAAVFLFTVPRRLAPLPLLAGASYITLGPTIDIGPFHFTVIRTLIAVGVLRVLLKGERVERGWNVLDTLMILWASWAVSSAVFHEPFAEALVFRLGMAYNALGIYFLLRIFLRKTKDVSGIFLFVILALVPIALAMLNEAFTGKNIFSFFGGVDELSEIRGGQIRASGPFAHSILAGTVGAVCLPMALVFWRENRKFALIGLMATGVIIITSRSSGPLLTCIFAILGLLLWKGRKWMRLIRWSSAALILCLAFIMNAPLYYLLARIDLTGSSTGYHRAILIEAAIDHLDDWWLSGTDYTRNWTPNAGFGNDTDITNHYLRMGIWGGLPLMCLFIGILIAGFVLVSKALRLQANATTQDKFVTWTLGCILFAHVVTMISVSYFDQSVFFLYLPLAAIASLGVVPDWEFEWMSERQVSHEPNFCHHS